MYADFYENIVAAGKAYDVQISDKIKTTTNKVKSAASLKQGIFYYKQGKKCLKSLRQGKDYYYKQSKKCHPPRYTYKLNASGRFPVSCARTQQEKNIF